jgi:hypothetical protein
MGELLKRIKNAQAATLPERPQIAGSELPCLVHGTTALARANPHRLAVGIFEHPGDGTARIRSDAPAVNEGTGYDIAPRSSM